MTREEMMEKAREELRAFDDMRYGFMMRVWAKVSDSPQKAAWLVGVVALASFVLGALVF